MEVIPNLLDEDEKQFRAENLGGHEAETGLGRAIRLREKINNGALPLSEELEENQNGGDRPTSEQGSEDGAGLERGHERTGAAAAGD